MYTELILHHPILSFFLYILLCAGVGIGLFFGYSFIRKRLQIAKNVKARAERDKLS